jgi:hypothetical protein
MGIVAQLYTNEVLRRYRMRERVVCSYCGENTRFRDEMFVVKDKDGEDLYACGWECENNLLEMVKGKGEEG